MPALALKESLQLATNEGEVYFALDGDEFDTDEITKFLGIEPSSISRKDKKIPGRHWSFSSCKLSAGKTINELIDVFEMASLITKDTGNRHFLFTYAVSPSHFILAGFR